MKTRKIISILCAASMGLAMTACDKAKETDTDNSSKSETTTKASADESKIESTDPAESAVESDVSELSESLKESSSANDSVDSKSKDSEAEISDDNAEENTASETGSDESDTMEVKNGGLIYHIPSNFSPQEVNRENTLYYSYVDPDGILSMYIITYIPEFASVELNEETFNSTIQQFMKGYMKHAENDAGYTPTEIKQNTILGRTEYEIAYVRNEQSNETIDYILYAFIKNPDNGYVNFITQSISFKDHEIEYDYIADAAKIIYSIEEDPDFVG
ncbi:hypothetical protein [Ruminococcus albus]|uniref:Lipoprotein n=1 Tax=Ruminococcus albus TaxID=1264 RepID=A0A1I1JBH5_RUMAL|nr:hypothetical protein [Ruminococcus albus]SFC45959.1 hypothetical protein SAMN02910406_01747 [Ruminococcus albus]